MLSHPHTGTQVQVYGRQAPPGQQIAKPELGQTHWSQPQPDLGDTCELLFVELLQVWVENQIATL